MRVDLQAEGSGIEGAPRIMTTLDGLDEWAIRRGGRVLVVDDSQTNRLVTSAILGKSGFAVTLACGGEEAVDHVRRAEPPPEIVLMDVAMPGMDGIDATRAIRALPAPACNVIIIALTAQDLPDDRQRCRDAGMDDFLVKPAGRQTLLRMLSRWLEPPTGAALSPAPPSHERLPAPATAPSEPRRSD